MFLLKPPPPPPHPGEKKKKKKNLPHPLHSSISVPAHPSPPSAWLPPPSPPFLQSLGWKTPSS